MWHPHVASTFHAKDGASRVEDLTSTGIRRTTVPRARWARTLGASQRRRPLGFNSQTLRVYHIYIYVCLYVHIYIRNPQIEKLETCIELPFWKYFSAFVCGRPWLVFWFWITSCDAHRRSTVHTSPNSWAWNCYQTWPGCDVRMALTSYVQFVL